MLARFAHTNRHATAFVAALCSCVHGAADNRRREKSSRQASLCKKSKKTHQNLLLGKAPKGKAKAKAASKAGEVPCRLCFAYRQSRRFYLRTLRSMRIRRMLTATCLVQLQPQSKLACKRSSRALSGHRVGVFNLRKCHPQRSRYLNQFCFATQSRCFLNLQTPCSCLFPPC